MRNKNGNDYGSYGRDQDLSVEESYEQTWAKAYDAESYDEWDNKDDDKWGNDSWAQDNSDYGASSYGAAASAGDVEQSQSRYGKSYGGYGGYGSGYGQKGSQYGEEESYMGDYQASAQGRAEKEGSESDQFSKSQYDSDFDSRYGKSYDFVEANEYDDEQYARKVRADDDQWAEDRRERAYGNAYGYAKAASVEQKQPEIKRTTYEPQYSYGGYGGW